MHKDRFLIRNLIVALLLSGLVIVLYLAVILDIVTAPLLDLYARSPLRYAVTTLLVVLGQAILLEWLTSGLSARFRLERFDRSNDRPR